jgi:hypothetical protein
LPEPRHRIIPDRSGAAPERTRLLFADSLNQPYREGIVLDNHVEWAEFLWQILDGSLNETATGLNKAFRGAGSARVNHKHPITAARPAQGRRKFLRAFRPDRQN